MTFDEPEKTESAIAAAFRGAGLDTDGARLRALILSHAGEPDTLYRRFATEKGLFRLLVRGAVHWARNAEQRPAPRATAAPRARRDLERELAPAAKLRASKVRNSIFERFFIRGRAIGTIHFREINAYRRESALEWFVLDEIMKKYGANASPDSTIAEIVKPAVLERIIKEAESAVTA